jgi:hypothetical protein
LLQTGPGTSTPELTCWDLFASVGGRPEGIALTRLAHSLHIAKENTLFRPLEELVDAKLIARDGDRYSLASNKRAQALNLALSFALAYELDYNAYFEQPMVDFLKKVFGFDYFSSADVPTELLRPEVLARLIHNELLLVYSFRPLIGKLIQNPFLDGLCEFLGIRRNRALFRKKIRLETVIHEKLLASRSGGKAQAANARKLLGVSGLSPIGWGLGPTPKIIKASVIPENTGLFDPEASKCYSRAWERMRKRVDEKRRLSVDLIREYHSVAMASTKIGGDFRDHQVQVRNNPHFKTAPPRQVESLLQELMRDASTWKPANTAEVLYLAAFLYNEFLYIHPFEDGNSRTARILLGHILREHQVPFEEIPKSYEVRFLQATKGYRKRNQADADLVDLLRELYIFHLNRGELEAARRLPG